MNNSVHDCVVERTGPHTASLAGTVSDNVGVASVTWRGYDLF